MSMFSRPTPFDDTLPMLTLDGQTYKASTSSHHASNIHDSRHADEMATLQRRLRLGTMLEMMYGPGVDEQALTTMPPQHLTSQWDASQSKAPNDIDSSLLTSQPHIQITPPPVNTFPPMRPFDVPPQPCSSNFSSPAISTPSEYFLDDASPEFVFQSNSFGSVGTQKSSEDWVHRLNTVPFEQLAVDGGRQGGSSPVPCTASQDIPNIQFPSTDPNSWDDLNLWAIENLDLSTSCASAPPRSLSPFESGYHLSPSSVFSSPYSSAPHSPSQHPSRSLSPSSYVSSTSSFSRQTSPDLQASSSRSTSKGKAKICSHCKATSTPLWRRDPRTQMQLCNACGLYLQQRNKLRPQELIDADADEEDDTPYDPFARECSHCHTRNTSVWRRNTDGAQLCNACGVYRRLRGKDRPLSLRRNRIKPRTKKNLTI